MVLWDSRTVHWNRPPKKSSEHFRMIFYVCMTPRSWASKSQLEKRKRALLTLRGTSHWPHIVKLFEKKPRTYGNTTFPDYKISTELPSLSLLGCRLSGFDDTESYQSSSSQSK
eukprot:TRINITY_DN4629_c0_g3_i2.p1 TRINITY_DN4629_c0_g3~~TRINITY_DN4629_c0_g3_i2.p1  ORF type:complete len:113 (+),score=13.99 TRINITY_DN4629_c0_g3_i2:77-415(+)